MTAQSSPYPRAMDEETRYGAGETVTETAETARDSIKNAAERAAETGSEMAGKAQDAAVDAYTSVKRFAQEQPVLAVAAVAVTAIAAGAIITRLARPSRSEQMLNQLSNAIEPYTRSFRR